MKPEDIATWLLSCEAYQTTTKPASDKKRKRQGASLHQCPSPPASPMDPFTDNGEQAPRKRVRTTTQPELDPAAADIDADYTPRAKRLPPTFGAHRGPPLVLAMDHTSIIQESSRGSQSQSQSHSNSHSQSQSQSQSRTSGRSSPRKRLRSLALQEDGVVSRKFEGPDLDMPVELRSFKKGLANCRRGIAIISQKRRHEIEEAAVLDASAPKFESLDSSCFPADDIQQQSREDLGPTPSVENILFVLEWAAECAVSSAEEAMWNSMVHCPLLQMAMYGDRKRPVVQHGSTAAVKIRQCTTARLIPDYLPIRETRAAQVDFCLCLEGNEAAQKSIDHLRRFLPEFSINQTDSESLIMHPIAVSFETKKLDSDGGSVQAKLQVGTWLAAQWKVLKALTQQGDGDQEHAHTPLPAFLPAVIISGHNWSFAAATQKEDLTLLWNEYPIGDTQDVVGVYKIVYGLQKLRVWAQEEYWPWYQQCVLGIDDEQGPKL